MSRRSPVDAADPGKLRLRLVLLILLAVAPVAVLLAVSAASERDRARREAGSEALRIAQSAGATMDRITEGARQLLQTVSLLPDVRDPSGASCPATLAALLGSSDRYANFGVAAVPSGAVVCSARPAGPNVSLADREYFRRVVATGDFSAGDYQVGRITGRPTVNFGHAVRDATGRLTAVAFAALDLDWLARNAIVSGLPLHTVVTIYDGAGTVLVRSADPQRWVGLSFPDRPGTGNADAGTYEAAGLDGVERLYGFLRVSAGDTTFLVTAGQDRHAVYAPVQNAFRGSIVALVVAAAVALGAAWWLGGVLIVAPVRRAMAVEHQAAEQLRELDRFRMDFLATVAHDLKSPLASVTMLATTLRGYRESLSPEDVNRFIDGIVASSKRVERMAANMLDADRFSRSAIEPRRSAVPVAAVLDRVVAESDGGDRTIAASADPVIANVDGDVLERILENLIGNAIKHTPDGSTIRASVRQAVGGLLVTVADHGYGIDDEHKKVVFEPFSRGMTGAPGSGLGLYLVSRFAALHDGRAWVEDVEGGGAAFFVFLAADVVPESSDDPASQHEQPHPSAS